MANESSTSFSVQIPPPPRGVDAWASLAGGLCMVAMCASRRMRGRAPLLAIGCWLLGRGAMGVLRELPSLEPPSSPEPRAAESIPPAAPPPEDPLDEANWESFPASDPPSITRPPRAGTSNGVH
jgi:hypothetical protein